MAMLDELHDPLPTPEYDKNIYTLGSIGKHNVVIACPPVGTAAPDVISMTNIFREIKFNLLVGVGSGISPDVRLGDVVVGTLEDQDLKETMSKPDSAEAENSIHIETWAATPPQLLLAALRKIKAVHELSRSRIPEYLESLKRDSPGLASRYLKPDSLMDLLFEADYSHVTPDFASLGLIPREENYCRFCDKTMTLKRNPREMQVHYGLIASANQEIKSAPFRDRHRLCRNLGGKVLCIEMEIAKMKTLFPKHFPCLVIRGICDYADSHKNKNWRDHAAIVAAAYTKDLLQYVSPGDADRRPSVNAPSKANEHQWQNPRPASPPPRPGSAPTQLPPIPHPDYSRENPLLSWLRPQQARPPTPPLRPRAPPPPPRSQYYAPNLPPWMPFSYNANTEGK